jgi:hypothetical protein
MPSDRAQLVSEAVFPSYVISRAFDRRRFRPVTQWTLPGSQARDAPIRSRHASDDGEGPTSARNAAKLSAQGRCSSSPFRLAVVVAHRFLSERHSRCSKHPDKPWRICIRFRRLGLHGQPTIPMHLGATGLVGTMCSLPQRQRQCQVGKPVAFSVPWRAMTVTLKNCLPDRSYIMDNIVACNALYLYRR